MAATEQRVERADRPPRNAPLVAPPASAAAPTPERPGARISGLIDPTQDEPRLGILVYGPAGAGKTVFAGTAADDARSAPVLFVDVEGGRLNIRHRADARFNGQPYPVDFLEVHSFAECVRTLRDYFTNNPEPYYKTLVIDSLSKLAELAMDMVVSEIKNVARIDRYTMERSDWNIWTNRLRFFLNYLKGWRVNVILTALEEPGEQGKAQPVFPGRKLALTLPGEFDVIGRLFVREVDGGTGQLAYRRRLQLQDAPNAMAKDRGDPTGQLPRFIENPTVTKLLDRMGEGQALLEAALWGKEGAGQTNKTS